MGSRNNVGGPPCIENEPLLGEFRVSYGAADLVSGVNDNLVGRSRGFTMAERSSAAEAAIIAATGPGLEAGGGSGGNERSW